jgi:hypothetical protein
MYGRIYITGSDNYNGEDNLIDIENIPLNNVIESILDAPIISDNSMDESKSIASSPLSSSSSGDGVAIKLENAAGIAFSLQQIFNIKST